MEDPERKRHQKRELRDNDYIANIKKLMGKEVEVGYLDGKITGILDAANFIPLNVVLLIDEDESPKIMIIKGPNWVREL